MASAAKHQSTRSSGTTRDENPRGQVLEELGAVEAASTYLKAYSRERPEMVAMWAFGLGFVLGWKLRIF